MQRKYKEQDVYVAIKSGFANLKMLARDELKKRWRTMAFADRCAAARALKFMDAVAANPEKYFSRAHTQDAWRFRAEYFASDKNLDDMADAYYLVEDPQGIVCNRVAAAMHGTLAQEYRRFCNAVQQWEYDRTSNKPAFRKGAPGFAREIVEKSGRYQALADINRANVFVRPFKQIIYQFQH